ncbi:MAG: methyltransferase domain-containing protein [Deltaproteobacteria bacterium]|nr:MAG: methyltransferase domain-containing protein [Deltaproteobacteria bacterium]
MTRLSQSPQTTVEGVVRARYAAAAHARQESLCCPIDYDPGLLEALPAEVIERDYGCGDPTRHVRPGEVVLDLGSGSGKACFMAAQVVGPEGRVIGVDIEDEMLALARRNAPVVAERIGYANVEFRRGRIQDLALDLDALDAWLAEHPVRSSADLPLLEAETARLRREQPLVADDSVDLVISNCVLNLVQSDAKTALFAEIFRVLRRGGRAVISDIVSDEDVPLAMQQDPELWSGCISGALREDRFLQAFEDAGFYGVRVVAWGEQPWRTVQGIEFRSVTVEAFKGKQGPCIERKQAVIYKGPFREVLDDDGHRLRRGQRVAVCDKTFGILTRPPYAEHFIAVPPHELPAIDDSPPFICGDGARLRHPRETKGEQFDLTTDAGPICGPGDGCC